MWHIYLSFNVYIYILNIILKVVLSIMQKSLVTVILWKRNFNGSGTFSCVCSINESFPV